MLGRKEWLCLFMRELTRVVFLLFYRMETEGEHHLPRERAFILLPKHQCWQDIPIITLATPRHLYYIAKHELFQNPISNRFLKALGGIPLNRERPLESRNSIRAMIKFLEGGEGLVLFPEGTYYRNRMGPGKRGMVRLLVSRLSLPLIPAGISYRRRGLRILARISFGRPILPDRETTPQEMLEAVMGEIARLSGLGCTRPKA
ncbi:MAG: 1-acyl-sn-glycerol-3-phosphate acyltransferase [Deltaproteobacteria bacterium]|nr:1-acyl-sn-glycerol-3-phosphate acyltransferase [Deltaproteobacteria bacterium]MBW2047444.1 1-acyl-sn-glycerol-3-phosphate acyltransferase [Deltaproteobacteria bacterium]MBW2112049.1 1-acyl-sn-glycerol-3-phosphate acyltransferase [Deltaproteobacteria bacterium]MBW2353422.1 1-acyl-sn-glycerol-3-phosphate acyltransferase [Deltaproteobacteria bacterium]HDZ91786.1 1-acyl-sn-glycerol-3-phosphate acyltransferase [Deltaproteobacteria bacterium]